MKSDKELLDECIGPLGTRMRDMAEQHMLEYSGRTPMACVLFQQHTHAGECDPDEIVYREKDIIRILEFLGYPVKFGDE